MRPISISFEPRAGRLAITVLVPVCLLAMPAYREERARHQVGFVVNSRRWVVQRFFAWSTVTAFATGTSSAASITLPAILGGIKFERARRTALAVLRT
jgi:hypothetical protein